MRNVVAGSSAPSTGMAHKRGTAIARRRMARQAGPVEQIRYVLSAGCCCSARCARSSACCGSSRRSRAPLPSRPEVLEWFWALGVPVREAYGQTENTALATVDARRRTCASAPSAGPTRASRSRRRARRRDPHPAARATSSATSPTRTPPRPSRRRGRLAAHRGRRRARRGRLPHHHRPQEGHHHHRGRQERLAVGDRERAQGLAVHRRSHRHRRPPQVPGRPHRHRGRHRRRLGRPT